MQKTTTAEAEGCVVAMVAVTQAPAAAMSVKASAFTIASLMADLGGNDDDVLSRSTAGLTRGAAIDSVSGTLLATSQQRPTDAQSPSTSTSPSCISCTTSSM